MHNLNPQELQTRTTQQWGFYCMPEGFVGQITFLLTLSKRMTQEYPCEKSISENLHHNY